jgi:TonB-linked SusC/RagA family outer membrane protein
MRNKHILTKWLLIMRLSLFFYFFGALQLLALNGSSQSTRIDLKVENKTLGEVLELISESAEYSLFFKDDLVGNDKLYNLDYTQEKLGTILTLLLNDTDLDYSIKDKLIVITPRQSVVQETYIELPQQKITVNGGVFESVGGESMPGVTVAEKNTTNGTLTDMNGRFELTVAPGAVLIFSHIGYRTLEIPAGEGIMNIRMEEDLQVMDEVVVIAYGETSQKTYTGSVATVKSDAIAMSSSPAAWEALQGTATGVQILHTSSAPGAEPVIRIRGISSVNFSSSPLVVLDGVPFNGNITSIDPGDIESMSVLKDATSTALYGSRASSGVVMITTKKGSGKQGTINFRHSTSITDFAVRPEEKLDENSMMEMAWEIFYNGGLDEGMTDEQARARAAEKSRSYFFLEDYTPWIDKDGNYLLNPLDNNGKMIEGASLVYDNNWEETLFKKGLRQEYGLDFSGTANEGKLDYFISGSYLKENGIKYQDYFDRLGARVNLNSQVTKWLKIGTRNSFSHSFSDLPAVTMRYYNTIASVYPINLFDFENREYFLDEYGNRLPDTGTINQLGHQWREGWNGSQLVQGTYRNEVGKSFSGSFVDNLNSTNSLTLTILPWLNFNSNVGLNFRYAENQSYGSGRQGLIENISSASRSVNKTVALTVNNLLNASKTFGDHNIKFLVGQEIYSLKSNSLSGSRRDFAFPGFFELSAAAEVVDNGSGEDNYRLMSYLSRIEYGFKDKYYITGSFRTDGSSRFSPENRWGNFWSIGGGWRMSEEPFIANISWIDDLKLKASYGTNGNDLVGTYYAYQGLYALTNEHDQPAAYLSKLPAPDLVWESAVKRNIGLDFAIFDWLTGSVEYFVNDAKNLLFEVRLPYSVGIDSELRNIGNNENRGLEFAVNAPIILNKNFSWDFDINGTVLRNKVTKTPDGADILSGINIIREGESMYSLFLTEWAGVNPENGNNQWYKNLFQLDEEGLLVLDGRGNPIVVGRELTEVANDANTKDHKAIYGKGMPGLFGSVSTGIRSHGFDFSMMLYYSLGNEMVDVSMSELTKYSFDGYAFYKDILNRWTPDNTNTPIGRLSDYNYQQRYLPTSTQWLISGDYLRLRNLVLGYTIPEQHSKRIGMKKLRVYFNGSNLFTFGPAVKKHRDPEMGYSGRYYDGPNDSSSATSSLKVFTFGLQTTFN